MSAPNVSTATLAARQALDLLNRASSDWHNSGGCESGSLHWPVAVNLARRELRQALEALAESASAPGLPATPATAATHCPCGREHCPGDCLDSLGWDSEDARAGILWFNSLTPAERRHWLEIARSAVDAWCAFQAGGSHL